MDNVTHALGGVLTAEVAVLVRRRLGHATSPAWPRAAWLVSGIAQNLPDADSLYAGITGGQLGYLLHHRGHTHTLGLVPVVAALSLVPVVAWAHARGYALSRADRVWLGALAVLGPVLHVAFDLSNDYGVHPLWPLHDGWFYGDTIFILEPLFWAATLPIVAASTSSRASAVVWALLLVLGLALTWGVGIVPWPAALTTTVLAAIATVVALRRAASGVGRVAFAIGASLVILLVFIFASRRAERNVREALAEGYPGWTTLDVALTPLPATPVCWAAVAVARDPDHYALRVVSVSAWPGLASPDACADRRRNQTTAPLRGGALRRRSVVLRGELEDDLASFRARATRCDVSAFLRWARAPFVVPEADGALILGDLRYDRGPELEFAELTVPGEARCPRAVPPWRPPRSDLLR